MSFEARIQKLNEKIAAARHIVIFSGAGISTGAGIPDFRSADGLYNSTGIGDMTPEYMLSDDCLRDHPAQFFEYQRKCMDFRGAEPTPAHLKISELQRSRRVSVITQNIDGLHERSMTEHVYAIHGTMQRFTCTHCFNDKFEPVSVLDGVYDNADGIPTCPECDGVIRPGIVLYGEGMNEPDWSYARTAAASADLLIVVGSSLTVYPAAYIPMGIPASKLVIINRDKTTADHYASLVFHEDIQGVFERIIVPD